MVLTCIGVSFSIVTSLTYSSSDPDFHFHQLVPVSLSYFSPCYYLYVGGLSSSCWCRCLSGVRSTDLLRLLCPAFEAGLVSTESNAMQSGILYSLHVS